MEFDDVSGIDLLWIPLGAGQRVVAASGRIFEALTAARRRRPRCALFHTALVAATSTGGSVVIEMAPVADRAGDRRGVVAEGPVGLAWAARFRVFRYEIRRWRDGVIPDAQYAVARQRVADDHATSQRLLELVPSVPTLVWGRDALHVGDMWNSNSVTSWLLARSGIPAGDIVVPVGGRAPGWEAGLRAAVSETLPAGAVAIAGG